MKTGIENMVARHDHLTCMLIAEQQKSYTCYSDVIIIIKFYNNNNN